MAEQVTNTLDAEALNTGLDLQGVNDPMDAMGTFNLEQLEQNNTDPGDPPAKKKQPTMADLEKSYDIQRQQLKQIGQVGIPQLADQSRNKFQAARVVEFDAKKMNVDRYLGYGQSTFNKVGFSPFIDNEKNFNENTSIWQDFGRMSSVFGSLAYEGGVSGYRSIGSIFSEDSFFTPDDVTAENFARLQNIGMSSKGGIGGFVNNFALNSAYTVGMGLSILAEEAALFGLTVVSEGATGGIAAMRTAANTARFGKAMKQAWNARAITNIASGGVQLARSLSKVGDAKSFYSAVKAGTYTLGKGVVQFINPLSRTTDDIIDMARGSASMRNMSNLAKAKQTFGSFYRDMRDNNLALSEAKLEGGSAKMDTINELISDYEKKNGKSPEGEDLQRIYQQAEDVGHGVTAVNFPVIMMTNKVVLDGLFKFRGFKTLDEAAEMATKGIGFKKGVGFYDALTNSWVKNTAKSFLNPKAYIGKGVSYFRRNLMEGVQENLQNVTSDAVGAYYDGVYKDPSLGGFDFAVGNAWNALGNELRSPEALETFASGFLMGGFMGKAQNLFLKDVPQVYYWSKDKVMGTTKLQEYKQNKLKTRQAAINGLNEMYNNPLKYFSSRNESAVVQKHTSDVMNQADANGDAKTFQDAKDLKMFDHVFTALDNGTFDSLLSSYKELSKLDGKELADFLGVPQNSKATEKLQEIIDRAQEIKDRYEVINDKFKNPFTPKSLKKGTPEFTQEAIAYRAFESAKKTAIASQYGFDRALQRMNGLYADLSSNRPVSKASSSDFTILTDLETLDNEITLLDKEVKSFQAGTEPAQKKLAEQKQNRLDRLMDYRDKLRSHMEKAGQLEKEQDGQIVLQFGEETLEPLKESYKSYLRELASLNNDYVFEDKINDSFAKLLDYYQLNQDARNYNKVVNNLLDPGNLMRHAQRLNAKFTELFENKNADINERVERAQRIMEISEMVKALAAQGVMLDPDELQEFVRTGKVPSTLIDAATLKDLDESSVKYAAAKAILDIDEQIKKPDPAAEQETKPEVKPAAATTAATEPGEKQPNVQANLDTELQLKLEDAYNQYIEETGSEISFDEFVKVSPRAARIKTQFNKGKKAEPESKSAATFTPTTPYGTPAGETVTTATTTTETTSAKNSADADVEAKKAIVKNAIESVKESGTIEVYNPINPTDEQIERLVKEGITDKNEIMPLTLARVLNIGYVRAGAIAEVVNKELAALEGAKPIEISINDTISQTIAENLYKELLAGKPSSEFSEAEQGFINSLSEQRKEELKKEYEKTQTPAEKTGSQKAQELIDSVSSIRDLPDLNRADSGPVTIDLVELISTGQAKAKDVVNMLNQKKKELLQNISPEDIQKGDIVTFVDGRKGFVRSVNSSEISVKTIGASPANVENIAAKDLSTKIINIEPGKVVSMEPTANIEVTPQEQTEVKASQDTKTAFTENSAAVKEAGEKAAKAAGTDNLQNLNNLLQNIGCKTGK